MQIIIRILRGCCGLAIMVGIWALTSRQVPTVVPPSHLLGISKNQAEPAGMKNCQNSRPIREGISNPVTLEAEWAGMTAEWEFICLDMRFGGVLNYVRTHSRANRDVPTEFERQSKDSDDIWIAFQLNSCNIEIDSGSNRNAFEVHSGSYILAGFEVARRFDSPSKAIRMFRLLLECRNGP